MLQDCHDEHLPVKVAIETLTTLSSLAEVVHRRLGRAVDAPLSAGLQARVSSGVRVVAGDVPEAARRARGAPQDAHSEHLLGTRQQAQR